ncbi:unnamed protein product [Euphydryas editha]|uniref:Uncharacterized protein n=1 Tax=Euphydryas editha TaxID=104508 RepID=A0AAU9TE56_EUPED|nr:unnamed protein product [Euphydryas editha]
MKSILSPPPSFCYHKNAWDIWSLNEKWAKWKRSYEIYSKACEIDKKPVEIQVNILLHIVGEQCREIIDSLPEKCMTIENIWKKLDEQFQTKRNVTVERHKFFIRDQQENESIEQYVIVLGKLAQTCEFRDLHDELMKDRLVCGISSTTIRERLLREEDLSLKKAMDICRAVVTSRTYSGRIKPENEGLELSVHRLKQTQRIGSFMRSRLTSSYERARRAGCELEAERRGGAVWDERGVETRSARASVPRGRSRVTSGYNVGQRRSVPGSITQCNYCGNVHKKFECPAYGQKCARCSGMNHFARVCGIHYIVESNEKVIYSLNNSSE